MVTVFIQNEAGSSIKHRHIDKTHVLIGTERVSRPYPYAYGFILETTSGDGDNVDCYIVTERTLRTGEQIHCVPVALLEQVEDGEQDHNVIAVPIGESNHLGDDVESTLRDFIAHVFDHVPGKTIATGRLLDAAQAMAFINDSTDN